MPGIEFKNLLPLFETQHEAALAASKEIFGISLERNLEYGGLIYQTLDGKFSYTRPIEGTYKSVNPGAGASFGVSYDARQVAYYHSHGAYMPGYDNENFSGYRGDIGYAERYNIDGYVVTPRGKIKYFDLEEHNIQTIGQF